MNNCDCIIEAKSLVKEYGGKAAVRGINFCVRRGECFGFLGPNGAGKSTTVRMITCTSPVSSGRLTVLDLDVTKSPREIKRRLGVVPQENNLDPDLSVLDNLLVYAGFFDIGARPARRKALELLDFFGLSDQAGSKVNNLSGGMKRRLTIARALVNSPDILILDEPTTGLDPAARHLVWQRLRRLREDGVTLLITTHYMEEAATLCNRLLIIDEGVVLEEGTPEKLVEQHIGEELFELGRGAEVEEEVVSRLDGLLRGHMVVGDTLYLFPRDSGAVNRELRLLSTRFSYQMIRRATLEDVFLKLTGKELA
ncbi:MAG: ABC transporter ATP-binding protein [Firmicutes bacterium]|nr:ABC transporter ATP-binding protein [Bacillota bacterium]